MRCDDLLICPVCRAPLSRSDRTFSCAQRHSFDEARSGSLDLMPQRRGVKPPAGDSKEMAHARRRTLQRGLFAPLTRFLSSMCAARLETDPAGRTVILDAGCGEGSHLTGIMNDLRGRRTPADVCLIGMDASRPAIELAARLSRDIRFAVADLTHGIWVADASVTVLLNVFAPRNTAEFRRVLRPDGVLVVVVPAPEHMQELQAVLPLLSIAHDKREQVEQGFAGTFVPLSANRVLMRVTVTPEEAFDLVAMTPSARHIDAAGMREALAGEPRDVTLAVDVLRFSPFAGAGTRTPGTTFEEHKDQSAM